MDNIIYFFKFGVRITKANGTAQVTAIVFNPGSDIDIAIAGQQFTEQDRLQLALKLDDLDLPYQIDLCHLDRLTNPALLDHIHKVGKELYLCRRNRDHSPRTDPNVHY